MKKEFVVYKTTYSGALMPKFYIGSTSKEKALSGKYFGSVKSKKYKQIFGQELQQNIHLFSIEILSCHSTRKAALKEELRLQVQFDVVKSADYINESLAKKNGYFGRIITGKAHPNFGSKKRIGTRHSEETKKKISQSHIGMKYSNSTKEKLSKIATQKWKDGKTHYLPPMYGKDNPIYGTQRSNDTKEKISKALKGKNNNPNSYLVKKLDVYGNVLDTYKCLTDASKLNGYSRSTLQYHFDSKGNNFKFKEFVWNVSRS